MFQSNTHTHTHTHTHDIRQQIRHHISHYYQILQRCKQQHIPPPSEDTEL